MYIHLEIYTRMCIGYVLGGPPHPVIVTIGEDRDYIRVLLCSYYTTITGWGGPPKVCGLRFRVGKVLAWCRGWASGFRV